jgi:FkbM family methyltransferase
VRILDRVRPHIDEASYLYGFARNLPERMNVTRFLLSKKLAQVRDKVRPRSHPEKDVSIELYGARHVVDLLGSEIYLLDEIYRERLYERIADFVPAADSAVVDVGANVGIFAIRQGRRGARVYAFEPNASCYKRLSQAVLENGLTGRVSTLNYAVGRATGVGTLRVPNNRTALGSVVSVDPAASIQASDVRITSLDQILPALGVDHIDLLKIDTEGAEVDVLRGAERTLPRTDRIILEYHSRDLHDQVGSLLAEHGFRQVLHLDTPAPYLPEAGMIYAERTS